MAEPVPSSGLEVRVRRSVGDLSRLDLARLRRAFEAVMTVDGEGGYQHWAGTHGLPLPMYGQHAKPSFLPWHRIYLAGFEDVARGFESGVVLPWWDWTGEAGIPDAFAAPEIDGRPNPLRGSRIGSDAWGETGAEHPAETSRQPGAPTELPSQAMVDAALACEDFYEFSSQLEQIHNVLHVWVGGTMATIPYAFYDPFCWVLHASIDRLWWLWQARHPDAPPSVALGSQDLAPFGVPISDAWDAAELGTAYADPQTRVVSAFEAGASSDRPSRADQLSFSDYAQAFAEIIAAPETTLPLTFGIYGSWGIGKSSLLQMIASQFEDDEAGPTAVHVVNFNAWEYNSSEKIWPALVRRVMEEMERRARWSRRARLWDILKRNASRELRRRRAPLAVGMVSVLAAAVVAAFELDFSPEVIAVALAALGVSGAAKLISDLATNPVSKWVGTLVEQSSYGEELPFMREIRADLRFLADQMGRDGARPRILVMIDDLDRCEPEKAVEVLQAVNQLLDFDAFVICLGIDARVITAAVEAHYDQLLGEAGASGYEYLDKIVQIPFRIPTPTPAEIEVFLSAQMPIRLEVPEATIDAVPSVPGAGVGGDFEVNEVDVLGRGEGEETVSVISPPPTQFEQAEVDGFKSLAPFIRSNPRHIKRLSTSTGWSGPWPSVVG
jgi:hypothetical protein